VERLLSKLRYPDGTVKRKDALPRLAVARGAKKERYRPDYVLHDQTGEPFVVVDAKAPNESPAEFEYQVTGYAFGINRRVAHNPVQYAVVTNGLLTLVYAWDNDAPLLTLRFEDFEQDSPKFVEFRSLLSYGTRLVREATADVFRFERPELNDLVRTFIECHDLIWKKEKMGPTDAFYEFAKLMFIKLREDNRITEMIRGGGLPGPSDFNFSVDWIEKQVRADLSDNPVGDILFTRIRDELEAQIHRKEKKRIFLTGERLRLRLDTVLEVVRRLEHFDLHGIDEDLNGRMFETFLNATVRGKELGQFFTPRSVTKYMTRAAELEIIGEDIPYVLDGCCGSGGFLIEAMAELIHGLDARTDLTPRDRRRLKKKVFKDHLYGIDASETIARIARLNMYLHGDGGSTIFVADTLDKNLAPEKGMSDELRDDKDELRNLLLGKGLRFDVVLTNPPFSMSYKAHDAHERRVLDQYAIAVSNGKSSASERSNVLFLERYHDLLCDGGELLTVIDNTVLNGKESQRYRDYLQERFIIRQIVALPFNTFFRAQANVQTSIVHLRKKEPGEDQGHVFMAALNNVGHDDHQRYTPERDNMKRLIEVYRAWRRTGEVEELVEPNEATDENLGCPFQTWLVAPEHLDWTRLDAFFYAPDLRRTWETLIQGAAADRLDLLRGSDLELIQPMRKAETALAAGRVFRYFEIGDVTRAGAITSSREDVFEDLPSRARLQLRTDDVLFAKNNSSRGTTVIVPPEFDGHLATTGFIGIRPRDHEEALLLWSVMESETVRRQIYYLAVTAVQPEVREDIFREQFFLPIPKDPAVRATLIEHARRTHELHRETRAALDQTLLLTESLFEPPP